MNYRGFIIDENLQVPKGDIESFFNVTVYNATEFFSEGTSDDHIIEWLKESNYVLVTSDIRMTIDALMENIGVLFINKRKQGVKFLELSPHTCDSECKDIEQYFEEKMK